MSKISAYTAITSVQSNDLLPVVDVHDTTMAASGTTKKMTLNQLPGGFATSQYPDQAPAEAASLLGTAGITGIQTAIASRNVARVDIPVIGDSITEGQAATTWTQGFVFQASRAIRCAYPTAATGTGGGQGFIPLVATGESSFTWPVTTVGSNFSTTVLGPNRNAVQMTGTQSFTWTAPAGTTSVRVMYFDGPAAGKFSWKVASGGATTVTPANTSTDLLTASITITSGQVLTIAWVSGTGSNAPVVDGIMHYAGDESSGITFHECGFYGWDSSTNEWNQPGPSGLNWAQCYANAFPGIAGLVIFLGGNDGSDSEGVNAATFQVNLTAFIATLRGASSVLTDIPIVLIIQNTSSHTWVDSGGWPAYIAAMRNIAAAGPNIACVDLNYRMPSVASNWNGGELYADIAHPTNLGHALIGEILAAGIRIA